MRFEKLTFEKITVRPVVVKLNRPVVARIATMEEWPLILIDLHTKEGIVGRSYLEPYVIKSMSYLVQALMDFDDILKDTILSPVDLYEKTRKSLHFVGYEGISLIAVSGLDMAVWDALAKAAGMPLCVFLGGSLGRVKSYNSNGLWLKKPDMLREESFDLVNEGNFEAIKLRLGHEKISDDLLAIKAVRDAIGEEIKIMIDFNQALNMADAIDRCNKIDDLGLYWIEEPILYDNLDGYAQLTSDLKTPIQLGENFYGPRELYKAIQKRASDLVMPDFMRIGGVTGWLRATAIAGSAGIPVSTHLYPEVGAHVMRVTETAHWLEWQDWANIILQNPYSIKDGYIEIPNIPGIGLEWDEKAVALNLYDK